MKRLIAVFALFIFVALPACEMPVAPEPEYIERQRVELPDRFCLERCPKGDTVRNYPNPFN